jgi:hypothetical protein
MPEPRVLPPFPTDDFTLTQLEHALNTCVDGPPVIPFSDDAPGEPRKLVGGEFTLSQFLDFMSGYDPKRSTLIGDAEGIPIYESWDQRYGEYDVIRALIARVRELEAQ